MSAAPFAGADFHCHLDLYKNRSSAREDLETNRILVMAMTTTPRAFEKNISLFGSSQFIHVGLGIHPELVQTGEADMALFRALLPRARIIGEIGLDGRPQNRRSLSLQRDALRDVFTASRGLMRLYSLHSPAAATDVLNVIDETLGDSAVTVMHWFSGSSRELRRAVEMGCYFSINRAMLSSPSGRQRIQEMPRERVVMETDGPFICSGGTPALPSDVLACIHELGVIWRESSTSAASLVHSNSTAIVTKARIAETLGR